MDVQLIGIIDMCRVCLAAGPDMSDLFASTYKQSVNLSALYTVCTSLAVHPDDGGPQSICAACLAGLIGAHEFREQCLATHAMLSGLCVGSAAVTKDDNNKVNSIRADDRAMEDDLADEQLEYACVDLKMELLIDSTAKDCDNALENHLVQSDSDKDLDEDSAVHFDVLETKSSDEDVNARTENIPVSKNKPQLRKSSKYPCSVCPKAFANQTLLAQHKNRHNQKPKALMKRDAERPAKSHQCPICHKAFQQSCTLRDHIRTHSGETPFLCSQCGKSFNNGSNLRQHVLRHTGVKPYKCSECPMRFTCKGGLKSHLTTHSGLKPFVCDVCGASFAKTYSLVKHRRIHTGERPYQCDTCDMRFNDSDHVKRHMRTHTGEKPYKCAFCDRAFAQSNDLVKHKRSHVGDKTYMCAQCPAAFRLHGELRTHARQHYAATELGEVHSS